MMKKLLFILIPLFFSIGARAQIREIVMNIHGGYDLVIDVGSGQSVTVTDDGHLVGIGGVASESDPVSWRGHDGLPDRLDGLRINYHDRFSTFDEAFYGKLRGIGNIHFTYYDSKIFDKEAYGKLKSVGAQRISYHSGFMPREVEKAGRPERIANVAFDFYSNGDFFISSDPYKDRKPGLLKSVDRQQYDYFFSDRGGGALGGRRRGMGGDFPRLAGPRRVRSGDVSVLVID